MTRQDIPSRPRAAPSRPASFVHAFDGWGYMMRTTPNAWIHLAATIAILVVGVFLRLPLLNWAVLALAVGLVWVAEFVNTAVEFTVDLASPEIHPFAKIAKDVAAAGVLTAAGVAVVVGLLVLGPPLLAWIIEVVG